MLALSTDPAIVQYVIAIVATLTVRELFMNENDTEKGARETLKAAKKAWLEKAPHLGDLMILLGVIGSASNFHKNRRGLTDFCSKLCLRVRAVEEVFKLMRQLERCVRVAKPGFELQLPLLGINRDQARLLGQIVIASFGDQIAVKSVEQEKKKGSRVAYECQTISEPVYLHPAGVFFGKSLTAAPEMILYQEVIESEGGKNYMRECMAISDLTLVGKLCETLCTYSNPIIEDLKPDTQPRYCPHRDTVVCKVKATFGRKSWPLGELVEIPYPSRHSFLDRYRWFARLLLEGQIFKKFAALNKYIIIKASLLTKTWAQDQPAISNIVDHLAKFEICSKDDLKIHINSSRKESFVRLILAFYAESDATLIQNELATAWQK